MRKIKFKGHNGFEWLYSETIQQDGDMCYMLNESTGEWDNVDGLGEYTGLKDKNGREIYEGDIVRWFSDARIFVPTKNNKWELKGNPYVEEKSVVEYSEDYGAYTLYGDSVFLYNYHAVAEIIGNIFEDSELLK